MGTIIYVIWGIILFLDMALADGSWGTMTLWVTDDAFSSNEIPIIIWLPIFLFNCGAMVYAILAAVALFVDMPIRGLERLWSIFKRGSEADGGNNK